ncbi:tRNA (N6-threonylcarbamoyladenosine(37)-N6)-methyltransferase TrmO [Oscillospiraceae bacterium LTW-04]|nr:tRNA (N6-threonylcarbamoyladenosine(37)-N6)-methyltransferase TrmO [Oscillospiraceae bacterium MB24-C1]
MSTLPPLKVIAKIHSDFPTKFGIPRQSGLVDSLKSTIVFEPAYRNPHALRGLEGYSHIWLIWHFSQTAKEDWTPTVRPPRLGGNTKMGVFASRSPFRPNAIGLSSVKLDKIQLESSQGPLLFVSGADLMHGTPIYDIKPYLPYVDCHQDATGGFALQSKKGTLVVDFPQQLRPLIPQESLEPLLEVLAQDPRPAYQNAPQRVYGFEFAGFEVRFIVEENMLTVKELLPLK